MATVRQLEDWLSSDKFWQSLNKVPEWRHIIAEDSGDPEQLTQGQTALIQGIVSILEDVFGKSAFEIPINDLRKKWYDPRGRGTSEEIEKTNQIFDQILSSNPDAGLKKYIQGIKDAQIDETQRHLSGRKDRPERLF